MLRFFWHYLHGKFFVSNQFTIDFLIHISVKTNIHTPNERKWKIFFKLNFEREEIRNTTFLVLSTASPLGWNFNYVTELFLGLKKIISTEPNHICTNSAFHNPVHFYSPHMTSTLQTDKLQNYSCHYSANNCQFWLINKFTSRSLAFLLKICFVFS